MSDYDVTVGPEGEAAEPEYGFGRSTDSGSRPRLRGSYCITFTIFGGDDLATLGVYGRIFGPLASRRNLPPYP